LPEKPTLKKEEMAEAKEMFNHFRHDFGREDEMNDA